MEQLYALGVTCIEVIQDWFRDFEDYLILVNRISNPNYMLEYVLPLVSAVDSVFGAQLCLCMAFGSWLNAVAKCWGNYTLVYVLPLVSAVDSVFGAQLCLCMAFGSWLNAVAKWWLLEDRPYWWIRETDFYAHSRRPDLRQFPQTCETGPGSPSGHAEMSAIFFVLILCWIAHIMNDRKCYVWWWKYLVFPLLSFCMAAVMLSRVYIAAHFPHQTFVGAMLGIKKDSTYAQYNCTWFLAQILCAFLAPALCIYFTDPYIWQYGRFATMPHHVARAWHVLSAAMTVAIAFGTYGLLLYCGWDPMWTVRLAFRWCESPDHIHVTTTPMYALAHSTGYLMGWAVCVTPVVAEYRHYTKERSITLALITAAILVYACRIIKDNIAKDHAITFYAMQFLLSAMKPALFLRIVPYVAMWPYKKTAQQIQQSSTSVFTCLLNKKKTN